MIIIGNLGAAVAPMGLLRDPPLRPGVCPGYWVVKPPLCFYIYCLVIHILLSFFLKKEKTYIVSLLFKGHFFFETYIHC